MSKAIRSTHRRPTRSAKPRQSRFEFPHTWGGLRKGSGRKPKAERPGVSHCTRAALAEPCPVQVTMRVKAGLPSLRGLREFAALRGAMKDGCQRGGCRLVHFSVLSNHLHMIVEGSSRSALSRGLQGLTIRMARALNRLWQRFGSVFADRYHDRILGSPTEVWNALRYVLCNARKHGAWNAPTRPDPCSSGAWFDGWLEIEPESASNSSTIRARTWLLNDGWRCIGLISIAATPRLSDPRLR